MAPVSRGRKPKKSVNKAKRSAPGRANPARRPESMLGMFQQAFGSNERPEWFDDSIRTVLDGARALLDVTGPRELEQLTAELVGAELHRAIRDVKSGLRFDWWFTDVADATRRRLESAAGSDEWRAPYWLLHGLAAIAPPELAPKLPTRGFVKSLRADPAPPSWLWDATRSAPTGDIWWMRDTYGTRYAVIAGFEYPHDPAQHVMLLDLDASGFVTLADVGIVDDVHQAAEMWRQTVGASAGAARPQLVTDPDQLQCLVHLDTGETIVRGDEPRPVLDNWFRADRRVRQLHDSLRRAGLPLPPPTSLYHGLDITVMTRPFTEWMTNTAAAEPNPESVDALAEAWMEGALPETWFSVSPRRVEFQLALIGDWYDDDITTEVLELLPIWVRWLGERGDLPELLSEPVTAAATSGGPADATPR
ncbi:MAG: hypothetical protein ACRCYX_07940 [Dermatophilaceae bacterium]